MFTDLDKHRKLAKLPAPQAHSVKMNLFIRTKKKRLYLFGKISVHINNLISLENERCCDFYVDNGESIACPFEQSWHFEKDRQIAQFCQPKAFHHCFASDTFQLAYNNRCQTNQGEIFNRKEFFFF